MFFYYLPLAKNQLHVQDICYIHVYMYAMFIGLIAKTYQVKMYTKQYIDKSVIIIRIFS